MTPEQMEEILARRHRRDALRMADSPGGGMILPTPKDYDFQTLTDEEEAAIANAMGDLTLFPPTSGAS